MRQRIGYLRAAYPRQMWVLFGGMLISATGGGMVWPFMTIYIRQSLDVPLATVGLLLTLNSAAGLVTTFVAGPVADHFGRKGVMMVSLVGSGLLYLAMTQATTLPQWGIMMVVMGALNPLFRVGSNAMVADLIPPDDRASAYALLRMSNNLGIAIGPAIGGFIAAVSYSRAFMTAAAGYFIFALLLCFMVSETLTKAAVTETEDQAGGGYGRLLRDRSFLAFCSIVTLAVIPASIMMVLLPVYGKEQFGVIESQYGLIMAANAAMVVLFQYTVTQVTKRFPNLLVMAVGALLYAVGVGSVALGAGFGAFLVSMLIMSLGELIMVPTGTTLAANLSPPDMRGRYMGIYGLTWGVGFGIGPALGGFLNDSLSPVAIWYGALIFGLLATAGFLVLKRKVGEPGQDRDLAAVPAG